MIKDSLFECKICGRDCKNQKELEYCEESCLFMIKCYQDTYKVSFEEAKSMFLMELI